MKNWQKTPWLSADAAMTEIRHLSTALAGEWDYRTSIRLGRRLAFAGSSLAFAPIQLELSTLDAGIAALRLSLKVGASTGDLRRSMAWLSKLRLDAIGCSNARITTEIKKVVLVENGCLVGSATETLDRADWAGRTDTALQAMNRGEFFLVSMGSDGRYCVRIRVVDSPEPCLSRKEYEKLEFATEVGFIRVTNSEVCFGAPEDLGHAAKIVVKNGITKVQCFAIGPRPTIIFVVCASEEVPPPLRDFPGLH